MMMDFDDDGVDDDDVDEHLDDAGDARTVHFPLEERVQRGRRSPRGRETQTPPSRRASGGVRRDV
jgi:hypothetical protein